MPETSPRFSDGQGVQWLLTLNTTLCRRMRDELDLDIADLQSGEAFLGMAADPIKFGALLWLLCEKQADARKISPESFGELLTGDVLDAAFEALMGAIVLFTRAPMRGAVQTVIDQAMKAQETGGQAAMAWMEEQGHQVQKKIKGEVEKALAKTISGV